MAKRIKNLDSCAKHLSKISNHRLSAYFSAYGLATKAPVITKAVALSELRSVIFALDHNVCSGSTNDDELYVRLIDAIRYSDHSFKILMTVVTSNLLRSVHIMDIKLSASIAQEVFRLIHVNTADTSGYWSVAPLSVNHITRATFRGIHYEDAIKEVININKEVFGAPYSVWITRFTQSSKILNALHHIGVKCDDVTLIDDEWLSSNKLQIKTGSGLKVSEIIASMIVETRPKSPHYCMKTLLLYLGVIEQELVDNLDTSVNLFTLEGSLELAKSHSVRLGSSWALDNIHQFLFTVTGYEVGEKLTTKEKRAWSSCTMLAKVAYARVRKLFSPSGLNLYEGNDNHHYVLSTSDHYELLKTYCGLSFDALNPPNFYDKRLGSHATINRHGSLSESSEYCYWRVLSKLIDVDVTLQPNKVTP